ncbi:MAG: hypothetical protein R3C56_14950 [Pirellulaceae bacterium]
MATKPAGEHNAAGIGRMDAKSMAASETYLSNIVQQMTRSYSGAAIVVLLVLFLDAASAITPAAMWWNCWRGSTPDAAALSLEDKCPVVKDVRSNESPVARRRLSEVPGWAAHRGIVEGMS